MEDSVKEAGDEVKFHKFYLILSRKTANELGC